MYTDTSHVFTILTNWYCTHSTLVLVRWALQHSGADQRVQGQEQLEVERPALLAGAAARGQAVNFQTGGRGPVCDSLVQLCGCAALHHMRCGTASQRLSVTPGVTRWCAIHLPRSPEPTRPARAPPILQRPTSPPVRDRTNGIHRRQYARLTRLARLESTGHK